jgi:hypothetical protein
MRTRSLAIALVFMGAARGALAQTTETQERAGRDLTQPSNVGLGLAPGATKDEPSSKAQVILEGSTDQTTGTATLTRNTGNSQFQLKLSSSRDANGDAVPFTLDGPASDTKATLSYSGLSWGSGPSTEEQARFVALCQRLFGRDTCKTSELTNADDLKEAEDLLHLHDAVWFWAAEGSYGRKRFRYLDDSLRSQSVYHDNWSGEAYVGRYLGIGFLVGSYSYGKGFSPGAPAREICLPLGDSGALRCQDLVLGAPVEDSHSVASLELRRFFGRSLGVAPLVQRDFENDVTALLLPVYFLKNSDGALMGGARAGWRSDDKAFTLAVFIGTAMTLTP